MSECRYHRLYRNTLRNSDKLPFDPAGVEVRAEWCAHSQARTTEADAKSAGGRRSLTCGGDRARCQLTDEQFYGVVSSPTRGSRQG